MLASLVAWAPSAGASSVVLCQGFSGCTAAGYPNFGYASVYEQMFWRMYAGHNCTNYVSYRMIQNGMPVDRPWDSTGDARNWGIVFASKTNQTPMVGSVAWWASNHVAYVQRVIDSKTIIISEDHYGGDFDWRRIVNDGSGWPTGFIHLTDQKVTNLVKPVVVGAPQVDGTVSATPGSWGQVGTRYTYQWYAQQKAIPGATTSTYKPTPNLMGIPLQVVVRATAPGYLQGAIASAASAPTLPGVMNDLTAPTVTGIAKVGATLTAAGGTFSPTPDATSYSWAANGKPIPGATGPTIVLGADQLNKTVTAIATATRAGYTTATQASAPTAPVGPENIVVGHEPRLAGSWFAGPPAANRRLSVVDAQLTPGGLTATYRWTRDGVVVPTQTTSSYLLGAADVGHRIAVTVTWTKPGYIPVVRTLSSGVIRAFPRIRVVSNAHKQITVSVTALGVPYVSGTVLVRTPAGAERTVTLHNGTATFSATWIYAGERTFVVTYNGSPSVIAWTSRQRITVE
jgi:surface antigen